MVFVFDATKMHADLTGIKIIVTEMSDFKDEMIRIRIRQKEIAV
jgi:hypothetical protein